MKIFFFMGRNPNNKSGVSWKIWKIERTGHIVTTWWGPARLHSRKVVPVGTLQSNRSQFGSVAGASKYESDRIQSKLSKDYERRPRGRSV